MTTLTLTASPSSGSIDVAIADAPRAATNLIPNPSFEATDTSAWSAYGAGTTVGRSTAAGKATDGAASLFINTGTDVLVGAQTASGIVVTPGKRYGARLDVFVNNGCDLRLRAIYRDSGGAQLTVTDHARPGIAGNASYPFVVDAGVAPAGAARLWLYVQRYSAAASGQFLYVDAVTVQELATGETFTGRYFETTRDGSVTVTRTDLNGTDAAVRAFANRAPAAGALVGTDYESALVGTVTYKVTDSAGQVTTAAATLNMVGTRPRVALVQDPQTRVTPPALTGYAATSGSASVVLWPIDRPDPIVLSRPARTREGTLEVRVATYADALAAAAVMAPGRPLRLRQADHAGMDMTFQTLDTTVDPLDQTTEGFPWSVRAPYVEVRA